MIPSTRLQHQHFKTLFGIDPAGIAVAPGRVNLIGEHTDYNDGFVLPMGIQRAVRVAFAPIPDREVRAFAADFNESGTIPLDSTQPRSEGWMRYVGAVTKTFVDQFGNAPGIALHIQSDVPVGAGLSSSAALELAILRAFVSVADMEWQPVEMAILGRRAENEYVGVQCGIMDQFASACAVKDHALLLDCRSLETRLVPLPTSHSVVIMDTGVRRTLAASAYNQRRSQCEEAVRTVKADFPNVKALRDVSPEQLDSFRNRLDPIIFARARHVVTECLRPLQMEQALLRGDIESAGNLMVDSHASLRDDYEVSSTELDLLVDLAMNAPGCVGARLTGAGFGGCTVALVKTEDVPNFITTVEPEYQARTGLDSNFYETKAADGAHLVNLADDAWLPVGPQPYVVY